MRVETLRIRFLLAALLLVLLAARAWPADDAKSLPLADIAQKAALESTLVGTSGTPFHIKVKVTDLLNSDSDYSANIEEYWVSSQKWRRTIDSPEFSQIMIVNNGKASEQNTGDYYPLWLRDIVTAVLAPLPMLEEMKGWNGEVPLLSGDANRISCSRLRSKFGVSASPIELTFSICFEGSRGLVDSVTTPQFAAQFKDYLSFKDKVIARTILETRDPGLKIQATVTELSELSKPDESLFAVQPIPDAAASQLQTVTVTEASLRGLAIAAPDIFWPDVSSGSASGHVAAYVSVDTEGYVREVWILDSDNPGLNDIFRKQLMKWQFKPGVVNGSRVQLESVLTFSFKTRFVK